MRMFFCNGKKDFCDERLCKDNCEFYDGSGGENVERKTNADRIRAMTDEELRKAISVIVKFESCINPMCGNCDQCPLAGICDLLEEDVLEWLQKPAEGD